MLAEAGFYAGNIDGWWGPKSRNAIVEYCSAQGITHVRVDRNKSNADVTISRVYANGKFICHGLEDEYRAVKKWGDTRIPAGTYNMAMRTKGGFHNRYKRMFGAQHKGMLHVLHVKNFKYILHHIGNYDKDTAGCLLLGRADYKAWAVWQSKKAYLRYYKLVAPAAIKGKLIVTYEDNDNI